MGVLQNALLRHAHTHNATCGEIIADDDFTLVVTANSYYKQLVGSKTLDLLQT